MALASVAGKGAGLEREMANLGCEQVVHWIAGLLAEAECC